ncbi:MAG: hypothetical protein PHQ53_02470 [Candidatus Krumholzibacteria bacterium]|nr:hypothetical protein [Candidatus Krumholzibacteria bacterium]
MLAILSSFATEAIIAGALAGPITDVKLVVGFAASPVTILALVALGVKTLRDRCRPQVQAQSS